MIKHFRNKQYPQTKALGLPTFSSSNTPPWVVLKELQHPKYCWQSLQKHADLIYTTIHFLAWQFCSTSLVWILKAQKHRSTGLDNWQHGIWPWLCPMYNTGAQALELEHRIKLDQQPFRSDSEPSRWMNWSFINFSSLERELSQNLA